LDRSPWLRADSPASVGPRSSSTSYRTEAFERSVDEDDLDG
jgi:hypothetical protein